MKGAKVNREWLLKFFFFFRYCESALKKLKLTVSKEDLESNETLHNLSMWQQVVMYYSFRLMLAPLIETVILIDRMLYLKENGKFFIKDRERIRSANRN